MDLVYLLVGFSVVMFGLSLVVSKVTRQIALIVLGIVVGVFLGSFLMGVVEVVLIALGNFILTVSSPVFGFVLPVPLSSGGVVGALLWVVFPLAGAAVGAYVMVSLIIEMWAGKKK